MNQTEAQVRTLLQEVSPTLGLHGGAVEFVSFTDGVVSVRFMGACVGCAAADMTLEYGLKELILIKCPEVHDVVAVNTEPVTHEAPAIPLHALS